MVSNAREDFPEPLRPVMTTSWSRGISRSMDLRLCSRAPRMTIRSLAIEALFYRLRAPRAAAGDPEDRGPGGHRDGGRIGQQNPAGPRAEPGRHGQGSEHGEPHEPGDRGCRRALVRW